MSSKKTSQEELIDFSDLGIDLETDVEIPENQVAEKHSSLQPDDPQNHLMVAEQNARERRRWKRFSIDGAFAMLIKPPKLSFLKPVYIKLGPVKDIGMKGLAIHYVEKGLEGSTFTKAPYLSILLPEDRVIVDKVPFKVVNSFKVADLPGDKEIWNLCVSFEKLQPLQRVQLEQFINRYGNEVKTSLNQKKDASGSGAD